MQGGETEKKSNTQQFRIPCENAKGAPTAGQRSRLKKMNFASYAKSRKPCELMKLNFLSYAKSRKPYKTKN